jgi:hypothetical protein
MAARAVVDEVGLGSAGAGVRESGHCLCVTASGVEE